MSRDHRPSQLRRRFLDGLLARHRRILLDAIAALSNNTRVQTPVAAAPTRPPVLTPTAAPRGSRWRAPPSHGDVLRSCRVNGAGGFASGHFGLPGMRRRDTGSRGFACRPLPAGRVGARSQPRTGLPHQEKVLITSQRERTEAQRQARTRPNTCSARRYGRLAPHCDLRFERAFSSCSLRKA